MIWVDNIIFGSKVASRQSTDKKASSEGSKNEAALFTKDNAQLQSPITQQRKKFSFVNEFFGAPLTGGSYDDITIDAVDEVLIAENDAASEINTDPTQSQLNKIKDFGIPIEEANYTILDDNSIQLNFYGGTIILDTEGNLKSAYNIQGSYITYFISSDNQTAACKEFFGASDNSSRTKFANAKFDIITDENGELNIILGDIPKTCASKQTPKDEIVAVYGKDGIIEKQEPELQTETDDSYKYKDRVVIHDTGAVEKVDAVKDETKSYETDYSSGEQVYPFTQYDKDLLEEAGVLDKDSKVEDYTIVRDKYGMLYLRFNDNPDVSIPFKFVTDQDGKTKVEVDKYILNELLIQNGNAGEGYTRFARLMALPKNTGELLSSSGISLQEIFTSEGGEKYTIMDIGGGITISKPNGFSVTVNNGIKYDKEPVLVEEADPKELNSAFKWTKHILKNNVLMPNYMLNLTNGFLISKTGEARVTNVKYVPYDMGEKVLSQFISSDQINSIVSKCQNTLSSSSNASYIDGTYSISHAGSKMTVKYTSIDGAEISFYFERQQSKDGSWSWVQQGS